MAYHSDPSAYGNTDCIASVSLGAEREFLLRDQENPDETYSYLLENGSLIIMGEHCQEHYEHAVPPDPTCHAPRINLTFRKFGWD